MKYLVTTSNFHGAPGLTPLPHLSCGDEGEVGIGEENID